MIGLAQKFTESFNCKSTSWWACITIDFSKTFDTFRWDAIEVTMELLGIDESFRQLVMSSMSALVEGSPRPELLNQGEASDRVTPYRHFYS